MTREIHFNAFDMNCVGHQSPGLWAHPRDRSGQYNTIGYWTDLAQILEEGKFDTLFQADVLGVYDVYGGSVDSALRHSTQVPVGDPALVVPAMAAVTKHLGFGVTATLSFEPPYPFARRMTTLDHLTNGRVGWNIVTGYLNSAAKGVGLGQQKGHDTRYDVAEDYLELVYKLWEGSWEDDAVVRDKLNRLFTHPEKVHKVVHNGPYFSADAIHLGEPSPQRTPLLFQAGASGRGRQFAADHAECVFIAAPTKTVLAPRVADIRARAVAGGRKASDILVFTLFTIIVGKTAQEARDKYEEYRQYVSLEGALTLVSGWTGIDFSVYDPDEPIKYIKNDAVQSAVEAFTSADPNRVWTVREIAEWAGIGGLGPVVVGSPTEVADQLEQWVNDTDIDGFNLAYAVSPESFQDIVELVVPELQRRGVYKKEYRPGTLREKLFGRGPRLSAPHPGARYHVGSAPLPQLQPAAE